MSKIPQRQAYGQALAEYGEVNPKVVVLDADVSSSTLTIYFGKRFPNRFFNLGVTEASMVDVGVGMALGGKIPFVNTFAALLTLRACEQIRTCVSYAETNVKLIGGYSGVSDYKDGPTHFSTNDMAVVRSLPNMVVLAPADNREAEAMIPVIADWNGPVYARISRANVDDVYDASHKVEIGKGTPLREGEDVTILATGTMVSRCIQAAETLEGHGIHAGVMGMWSVKPLDLELLLQAAKTTGALVTAEDHSVVGGFGSAVAEALASRYPVPIEMVGIQDVFPQTGPDPDTLMDASGMSVADVVRAAQAAIDRKKRGSIE